MTVSEAIDVVRRIGIITVSGEKIKIRFPEKERAVVEPAIETLRSHKPVALELLADPAGVPWADWQAARLNRIFAEQGATAQPGRITADTVRHGERLWIN